MSEQLADLGALLLKNAIDRPWILVIADDPEDGTYDLDISVRSVGLDADTVIDMLDATVQQYRKDNAGE